MTELKPFQLEGARAIRNFGGRALLADDMGLGKTIQSLYWLTKVSSLRPALIIAPAGMKWTWQAEAAHHFGLRATVIEGRKRKLDTALPSDITILNYAILESWLPVILDNQPQLVIVDECHYCKNVRAKRTKAVMKVTANAKSVVGLSGTPLTNRPIELWPVLKMIKPRLFPNRGKFAWRYCAPKYTPWGWQYDGATRLDELNKILYDNVMIRRTKADVLQELPNKTRKMIHFKLKDYREYHKAQDEFLKWLKEISPERAVKAKRSQALTKVGYLLRLVSKLKMDLTKDWIGEFFECHSEEKLLAFTNHRHVVDDLKSKHPDCVVIDGRVTGKDREKAMHAFQGNKKVRLLVANIKAAGVGLTLTAARQAVFLDFPWTPGDLLQAEDRCHRIGQEENVMIHYLSTIGTVEEKLINILRNKADVLDAVLNGHKDSRDFDIFSELLTEIK